MDAASVSPAFSISGRSVARPYLLSRRTLVLAITGGLCSIPGLVLGQDASKQTGIVVGILNSGVFSRSIEPPSGSPPPRMPPQSVPSPRRSPPLAGGLALPFGTASVGRLEEGISAFRAAAPHLSHLRFVEGQGNDRDTLSDRVRELAEYKPAAIVTVGTLATLAAANLTTSTPIVMVGVADPVGLGIVDSLARPGRNVTGVSLLGPELLEKNMDFLLEASPSVQRLAVLWNAANPGAELALRHLEGVVRARGLNFVSVPIRSATEVEGRLAELRQLRFDASMVVNDPLFLGVAPTILAYCLRRRLPSVFSTNEWVVRGGLLSYEPDPTEMHQRAAEYVVKILGGRHPRDLPVEQPTRFRLTINARAAGVIGLTLPRSLLAQADQVIE